jgi:hypothetical protein
MQSLVLALRKVPIFGLGGGALLLGDKENPKYSVVVTGEVAGKARRRLRGMRILRGCILLIQIQLILTQES